MRRVIEILAARVTALGFRLLLDLEPVASGARFGVASEQEKVLPTGETGQREILETALKHVHPAAVFCDFYGIA